MSTNFITRWFKGWLTQTHEVENNNTIVDGFQYLQTKSNTSGGVKKLHMLQILQMLCITKLKAVLIKSLSNPLLSSRVPMHENTIAP